MKILMFPWVDEVNVCLVKLEELKRMPQLTKLGLKKWRTTNSEARILSKYILQYQKRDMKTRVRDSHMVIYSVKAIALIQRAIAKVIYSHLTAVTLGDIKLKIKKIIQSQ